MPAISSLLLLQILPICSKAKIRGDEDAVGCIAISLPQLVEDHFVRGLKFATSTYQVQAIEILKQHSNFLTACSPNFYAVTMADACRDVDP